MTDVAALLARLETIEVARNLIARYAEIVDAKDPDGFASIFAAEMLLTTPTRRHEGISDVTDYFRGTFESDPTPRRHFISNTHVTADDAEHASARSYFIYTATTAGESIIGWGKYTDRFERVDGELRFASKHIEVEFRGPVTSGWLGW